MWTQDRYFMKFKKIFIKYFLSKNIIIENFAQFMTKFCKKIQKYESKYATFPKYAPICKYARESLNSKYMH